MHEYGTEPNIPRLVWRRAHSTLRCCWMNIEQKTRLPRYNSRKATTSNQTKIKYKTSSVFVVCVLVWRYKEGTRFCIRVGRTILSAQRAWGFISKSNLAYGFRFEPIRYEGEHFNRPANECFVYIRIRMYDAALQRKFHPKRDLVPCKIAAMRGILYIQSHAPCARNRDTQTCARRWILRKLLRGHIDVFGYSWAHTCRLIFL